MVAEFQAAEPHLSATIARQLSTLVHAHLQCQTLADHRQKQAALADRLIAPDLR